MPGSRFFYTHLSDAEMESQQEQGVMVILPDHLDVLETDIRKGLLLMGFPIFDPGHNVISLSRLCLGVLDLRLVKKESGRCSYLFSYS